MLGSETLTVPVAALFAAADEEGRGVFGIVASTAVLRTGVGEFVLPRCDVDPFSFSAASITSGRSRRWVTPLSGGCGSFPVVPCGADDSGASACTTGCSGMPLLLLLPLVLLNGRGADSGFTTVRREALTGMADGPRTSAMLDGGTDLRRSRETETLKTGFVEGEVLA